MRVIFLAVLSLCTFQVYAIEGGTVVSAGSPLSRSVVGVWNDQNFGWCTGTLIGDHTVLTAAHCVVDQSAGDTSIGFGLDLEAQRQVTSIAISPKWNENAQTDIGDLALVHFSGTLPSDYQPAPLLTDASLLVSGASVVLAGFGVTNDFAATGAGVLRATTVLIVDPNWSASEVSLDQTEGHGACEGDSGGPAFIQLNGNYYVWGVTSRGNGNHNTHYPCSERSIYTNALLSSDWIGQNTN